jgi:hypothetical protein
LRSHPFAKSAKGWGTEGLWGVEKGGLRIVVSHPFAKSAKGWGTDGCGALKRAG